MLAQGTALMKSHEVNIRLSITMNIKYTKSVIVDIIRNRILYEESH